MSAPQVGERPNAEPRHRGRIGNGLRTGLHVAQLESVGARQPDRAPAVDRAERGTRAGSLLPRAYASDGRCNRNADLTVVRRKAAIAKLAAIVRAPAVERAIRSHRACVREARADLRPPEAALDANQRGPARRKPCDLAGVVRAPTIGIATARDRTRVSSARAHGRELHAGRRHQLRKARTSVAAPLRPADGVGAWLRELVELVASPAVHVAIQLQPAGVVSSHAHGLPVAPTEVVEHRKPSGRRSSFRAPSG